MRRAAAVVVALALALVGCRDDPAGPDAGGSSGAPTTATTAAAGIADPDGDGDGGADGAGSADGADAPEVGDDPDLVPEPLPAGDPGDLLAVAEVAAPAEAPAGSRAWRVLHLSRTRDGAPTAVSGRVFAPPGAPGPGEAGDRPVVAWAHGTTGAADRCTPARLGTVPSLLGPFLEAGWVVAETDYEGLGTPGVHPYLVGASEGRAVLDVARAAGRLEGAGAGDQVLAWGHSQGGHAVLFAGQLAPTYAPELDLLGVVAAAPAVELGGLLATTAGANPLSLGFFATIVWTWSATYPELALADVLTPEAAEAADVVERDCLLGVTVAFARPVDQVVARAPADVAAWAARLEDNTPDGDGLVAPVLVVHGQADQLIALDAARAAARRLCAAGAAVQLQVYPGADHGAVVTAAGDDVLAWAADRRAGGPAPSNCDE